MTALNIHPAAADNPCWHTYGQNMAATDIVEDLLSQAWWFLYLDGKRSGELGREVVRLTEPAPDHPARGYGWFHSAYALTRAAQFDAGRDHAAQARACFLARGDQRGLLLCDECEAMRLHNTGHALEALQIRERILARADVQREPIDLYISHNLRAITRKLLGQVDGTLHDYYLALEAAEQVASPGPRLNALVNLGGYHCDLYNLVDARSLSEQAFATSRELGAWTAFSISGFNLIQTYDGLNLGPECMATAEQLLAHEDRLPPGMLESNAPCMALAYLNGGDLARCARWLDHGPRATFGDGDGKTDWTRVRARLLLAQGLPQPAWQLASERLQACQADLQHAEDHDQPYPFMKLLQVAADAAEALGDTASALALVRQAAQAYETLVGRSGRARFLAMQAEHDFAQARRERDQAERARQAAETDRLRLAELNQALQQKVAEAEALQQQLREQAVRDPLTGLHNRRFLYEAAPGRIELSRRQGEPLSVALLDIDHFKRLNDTHGHDAGDLVLKGFARVLAEGARQSDLVCRHGGEEFVVLMTGTDAAAMCRAIERLLEAFRSTPVDTGAAVLCQHSFSAGVASFGPDGDDLEALLKAADRRLYAAKAAGRARVLGDDGPAAHGLRA